MLWWLVGLWLASPALLPIVWLLGNLRRAPQEKPETASHGVSERIMRDQRLHRGRQRRPVSGLQDSAIAGRLDELLALRDAVDQLAAGRAAEGLRARLNRCATLIRTTTSISPQA